MNKTCYKCGATEELSKRGKTVMICKSCRRAAYHAYRAKVGYEPRKPAKRKHELVVQHRCYKCGTLNDIESNKSRISSKRYECFKCSVKPTHSLALPHQPATPEWMARAKASYKKILELRT